MKRLSTLKKKAFLLPFLHHKMIEWNLQSMDRGGAEDAARDVKMGIEQKNYADLKSYRNNA